MNWLGSIWKALKAPLAGAGPEFVESLKNFTPRAQQVLALARKEADRLRHNFVGTEHVLLGLIKLGQGTAFTVLGKMGLDLETVRLEVEEQVGAGHDQEMIGTIPYTPRVRKVLALAASEARALNHTYVGTEHILLGLLHEGDGVAARVLKNLRVDIEQTRTEILRELDPNFAGTVLAPELSSAGHSAKVSVPAVPGDRGSPKLHRDAVDTGKRYDVYCAEGNQPLVVYRNVLFKDTKVLFKKNANETFSEFVEIEQVDGQTIFLNRFSVIKFCEHGVTPRPEPIAGEKP